MDQKPGISVIIPAYNRSATIVSCIQSITNQTFQPVEIIVIDDYSTDNTVEIIEALHNSRIRVIKHQSNRGAQEARNTGIREARGEWISFQDSDDEWMPNKLEKQVEVLRKFQFDPLIVVHSDALKDYVDRNIKKEYVIPFIHGKDVLKELLISPGPMFPGILTSKEALQKIGYLDTDLVSHQEWDTSIRLARICRFYHIQEPLFLWKIHSQDSISKNPQNQLAGYEYVVTKFKSEIQSIDNGISLQNHYISLCAKAISLKLYDEANRYFDSIKANKSKREIWNLNCLLKFRFPPELFYWFDRNLWFINESIYLVSSFGFKFFLKKVFKWK